MSTMLPANRQKQILALLGEQGAVTITGLSQTFGVSEMTIHRDLDKLAAEGCLHKVRGGAVLPTTATTAVSLDHMYLTPTTQCLTCYKKPRRHIQVVLQLIDGEQRCACCPHCGLISLARLGELVDTALVTDFLHGRTISVQTAHYVVDPEINICCTPTTIAFQQQVDVERFQRGFGGQVMGLPEAMAYIGEAMQIK